MEKSKQELEKRDKEIAQLKLEIEKRDKEITQLNDSIYRSSGYEPCKHGDCKQMIEPHYEEHNNHPSCNVISVITECECSDCSVTCFECGAKETKYRDDHQFNDINEYFYDELDCEHCQVDGYKFALCDNCKKSENFACKKEDCECKYKCKNKCEKIMFAIEHKIEGNDDCLFCCECANEVSDDIFKKVRTLTQEL